MWDALASLRQVASRPCDCFQVVGGFSHMLSAVLEHLLLGPSGLTSVGLPLLIAGVHRMLFGRLANLFSDGDGHRQALDWKGANGLKPCIKHVNVLKKDRVRTAMRTGLECEWLRLRLASFRCGSGSLLQGSDLVDIKPGFVEIICCDHTQLRAWTTEKAFRAADILGAAHQRAQDGVLTKRDYDDMEMSAGLNRNPLGLLACRTLRSRGRQLRDATRCGPLGGFPLPSPRRGGHQMPPSTFCL